MPSARPSRAVEDPEDDTPHSPVGSTDFEPSAQQHAIFDWFKGATGNLVVRARAGTGKTTTILRAITFAPEQSILLCAFNKRIQEELARLLVNPHAIALTLHSVGFRCIRQHWPSVRVAHGQDRANALAHAVCVGQRKGTIFRVAKLLTKARELAPMTTTIGPIVDLAIEFDLLPEPMSRVKPEAEARMVLEGLKLAAQECPTQGIDFADMIFLPLRNEWVEPVYDLVVVDEAQDMTKAQLEIASLACAGRLALVGDDRQGIYRFRGADSGALDRMKVTLNATELGLTTTYRCPKVVVETANRYVADYFAAASAPQGIIDRIFDLDALAQAAQPGDFILSRKNAPLMGICMKLLRAGKPARVQGKDIGQSLSSLVRKLGYPYVDPKLGYKPSAHPLSVFIINLRDWEVKQAERLRLLGKEDRIESILDKSDTLRAIAEDADTVQELEALITALFADESLKQQVICSSVHKAKGLESRRVFVLERTLHPPLPCAECNHWHSGKRCFKCFCDQYHTSEERELEEANIAYVAITRAKEHLTWVDCKF